MLKMTIVLATIATMAAFSASMAAPLTVVQVKAPDVNCVFDASCKLHVTDSVADLPQTGGYTGRAVLQSRTAPSAAAGVPGAGTTVYLYRVDLTGAKAAGDQMCVRSVTIDFGPVTPLPYKGAHMPKAHVFVITAGGLGSIGLQSADQTGSSVTFKFSDNSFPDPNATFKPVCAGQTSFFFGLASTKAPAATKAQVQMGVYGLKSVPARAPKP